MALKDLVNMVLSQEGSPLTQVGFGTLALLCYHTHYTRRSETYSSLAALVADGFATTSAPYKMLARALSAKPNVPSTIKVLRYATPFTQSVKFTPTAAINNTIYGFTVTYLDVDYDVIYTSDGSATLAEICTGLATAFAALPAAISTHATASGVSGTFCQVTANTAGDVFYFKGWVGGNLKFKDVTPDPGLAAELAIIRAADSDWYGLALDLNAEALIAVVDTYVETIQAIFGWNVSSDECYDNTVTTDIFSTLKSESAGREFGFFALDNTAEYTGVAALAERLPNDPGSDGAGGTFALKTYVGVSADALTDSQKANLKAKNANVYITTAGRSHSLYGLVGGGEFIDIVRGLDWYKQRSEESIANWLLNQPNKAPFTDKGISGAYSALRGVQLQGEGSELFVEGSTSIQVPKASAVPDADRKARKLSGIKGSVTMAGAIQLVDPITVSVQ